KQRADNGRARTGRAGEDRSDELEHADEEGGAVGDRSDRAHTRHHIAVAVLDNQEQDTKQDQHNGDRLVIVEQGVEYVVEQDANHAGGDRGHQDLAPHVHLFAVDPPAAAHAEGEDIGPVDQHDGKDGAKLDDDQEDLPERLGDVKLDKLVEQDHVSGAADREPFGDP